MSRIMTSLFLSPEDNVDVESERLNSQSLGRLVLRSLEGHMLATLHVDSVECAHMWSTMFSNLARAIRLREHNAARARTDLGMGARASAVVRGPDGRVRVKG